MRKLFAIFVGFAIWTGLWLGGNYGMRLLLPEQFNANGIPTQSTVLGIVLGWACVVSIVGGLTQALVVRAEAMKSGWALGVLLLLVGFGVQSAYWTLLPLWYHLSFLALLIPCTLIGSSVRKS